MVQITGKYKRTSTENFEEFLNKLEIGSILKKAALASAPTMEVSVTSVVEPLVTQPMLQPRPNQTELRSMDS